MRKLFIITFIFPAALMLFSFEFQKRDLPVGSWQSAFVAGRWEDGPCEDTSLHLFVNISEDGKGEYFYHRNGDVLYYSWGTCRIDTIDKMRCLSFYDIKTLYQSMSDTFVLTPRHYPLVKLAGDTMILRFNMCCNVDTCGMTSGWVELVKKK